MPNSIHRAAIFLALARGIAVAATPAPPHLNPTGQAEYREYVEAQNHKAFAIAPGGAWGWTTAESTAKAAEERALGICQGQTTQRCVRYAVDDKVVFDAAAWPRLWGPYADRAKSKRATVGREPGQRMHDLAFRDPDGKPRQLSSLKGRVVVLHFWGAWCPPCRQEMPDLRRLQASFAGTSDIAFVVLQAREKFTISRQWADRQGISLPLSDSGSTGDEDIEFRLAGGRTIKDREIASRFPTTYVLDKHGLVIFSHVGPVHDWSQYEPFLRDAANRSGK